MPIAAQGAMDFAEVNLSTSLHRLAKLSVNAPQSDAMLRQVAWRFHVISTHERRKAKEEKRETSSDKQ